MPTLYIVATPIGNLGDISKRAVETLQRVDLILCEDTRRTQKLLNHFNVKTKTLSYHQHSKIQKINQIVDLLKEGKDLALVSDAGTPGISDPGNKLIGAVTGSALVTVTVTRADPVNDLKIVPIPGPSALTAAASVSGISMDKFLFLGFPPAKRKRQKFFEEVVSSPYPVILYESPHRILKTLHELGKMFQVSGFKFHVIVCRELTKLHETTYRGAPDEIAKKIKGDRIRGEFVIVVKLYGRR